MNSDGNKTSRRGFAATIASALIGSAVETDASPLQKKKGQVKTFHNPPVIVSSGSLIIDSKYKFEEPTGNGPYTYRITGLQLKRLKVFIINSEDLPVATLPFSGNGLSTEVFLRRLKRKGVYEPIKAMPEIMIRYNVLDPPELVSSMELTFTQTTDPERPFRYEYKDTSHVRWGRVRVLKSGRERFKRDSKETDIDMKILIDDHV